MDIQSIRKIFFPAINNAIKEMEEKDLSCNVTLLKRIINEAVDGSLNRNHSKLSSIVAEFSGRGRAWAKIKVDNKNEVWSLIKETLESEMNASDKNSIIFERCSNMLDLFKDTGISWVRFAGINNKTKTLRFQIRIWGSKLEDHIKIYIDEETYRKGFISNLEGVPHNLGLESGNFSEDKIIKKEKIDIEVNAEDLNSFGIQTLEDILNEGNL